METQAISTKRAAEDVGQQISRDFADYLTDGFRKKFPEETPSVFITRDTIMQAIGGLDNVSGVRFMYGFESADDSRSRIVLMIPCNNTSTHQAIPNSIILPQGYMAHNGSRVNFEKTWQLLYNHTVRLSKYLPELPFNKIMRGTFMGINSLLTILEIEGCAGINFNFGYDDTIVEPSAKNKPVFEVVNIGGVSFDPPWDFTKPCPDACDFTIVDHIDSIGQTYRTTGALMELNLSRHFRDEYLLKTDGHGPFIEMYYYIKHSIIEKAKENTEAVEIYKNIYHPQITVFNRLLAEDNYDKATIAFENTVRGMMETYFFQ